MTERGIAIDAWDGLAAVAVGVIRRGLARPSTDDPWRPSYLATDDPSRWIVANAVTALLYLSLGYAVGRFFAAYGLFPAPIWLPAGIAVVAAMVGGYRLLPGIFIGSFVVNYFLFDPPFHVAAIISLTNALGPWIGALVTRRFRPPTGIFTRFTGVLAFIGGAVLLHAAITAAGGTLALSIGKPFNPEVAYSIWLKWWLCDSGGTLYSAAPLLLWLGAERTVVGRSSAFDRRELAVWIVTALVAIAVFTIPALTGRVRMEVVFLLAVPLSWIALRMSLRGAYTLVSLISIIATAGTVAGYGPFQAAGIDNPLQVVGMMVVLFAMNVLTIVALVSERREAEEALAEANRTLEGRIAERTEELRRQAETDPLTGVSNRRAFLQRANLEVERARRYARPLSLIAFDLDHFKAINDTCGHTVGDAALQAVTRTCEAMLRVHDNMGRLGGEEFAVALPELTLPEARQVAERLCTAIAATQLRVDDRVRLSASFGVAELADCDLTVHELLTRADHALYLAKAGGRNRVEAARPKLVDSPAIRA